MRDRELDEFSSLFRRALIPTIEVEKIRLDEVIVFVDFGPLASSCAAIAVELKERCGAHVSLRFLLDGRDAEHEDEARAILEALPGDHRQLVPGDAATHVQEVIQKDQPALIIAPAPFHFRNATPETAVLGEFIDSLLVATAIPTLLVRAPLDPAQSVFRRILAKIPGGRHELIEQFSFAFALCPPQGEIQLLHVIEEERLRELAELLEVTPTIDTKSGGADLAAAVESRMDHLLRGAVRTAKDQAFTVKSDIETGDPAVIVPAAARDASLLILGSQTSHEEFLTSRGYALLSRIPDIPVLAL